MRSPDTLHPQHGRSLDSLPERLVNLTSSSSRSVLSGESAARLRDALATCVEKGALTPEAREVISSIVKGGKKDGLTPEQLLVAVKDTCYGAPEIAHLTTSEREAFLAKVMTHCIQEFFRAEEGPV